MEFQVTNSQNKLFNTYTSLEDNERRLLEIIYLASGDYYWYMASKDELFSLLKKHNVLDSNQQPFTKESLKNAFKSLETKGLLTKTFASPINEIRSIICICASELSPEAPNNLTLARKIIDTNRHRISYSKKEFYNFFAHQNEIPKSYQNIKYDTLNECSSLIDAYVSIFENYLHIEWLKKRKINIKAHICISKLLYSISFRLKPRDYDEIVEIYKTVSNSYVAKDTYILYLMIQIDIAIGLTENIPHKINQLAKINSYSYAYLASHAAWLFINGEAEESLKVYKKALPAYRKFAETTKCFFTDLHGIFMLILELSVKKNIDGFKRFIGVYKDQSISRNTELRNLFRILEPLSHLLAGDKKLANNKYMEISNENNTNPLYIAFRYIIGVILNDSKYESIEIPECSGLAKHLISEAKSLDDSNYKGEYIGKFRLLDLIEVKSDWDYALASIENIIGIQKQTVNKEKRIAWLVDPEYKRVNVLEQSLGKTGWSKGKAISLKRLYEERASYTYLTDEDQAALSGLKREYDDDVRGGYYYAFSPKETILKLAGNTKVFHMQNSSIQLEIVLEHAQIYVSESKDSYTLRTSHGRINDGFILEKDTTNRYKYIQATPEYEKMANIIGQSMSVPIQAKDRISKIVGTINDKVHIQADIEELNIKSIKPNTIPHLQLMPVDQGIQVSIWIRPFKEYGPYCKAGKGNKTIITNYEVDGQAEKCKTTRNFAQEKKSTKNVLSSCFELEEYLVDDNTYQIDEVDDILDVLSKLEEMKTQNSIFLEWPKGQKYKIAKRLSAQDFSLSISSEHNWFEYDGSVRISPDKVMHIRELLDALEESNSRFISLSDTQFLELSNSLRKQLDKLRDFSEGNKIYNLNSSALMDLSNSIDDVEADKEWKSHLSKIKKMDKYTPEVPSSLQAELRDYQEDGFKHMSKLANWGIGSCLADDMGLGKTVQAIALILEHAPKGPTLVISPTSVSFNWENEIKRFAPSLNVFSMYNTKDLDKINKFDVLISSYGLVQSNEELLSKKKWQTIIVDEAQAIKNPHTKRYKAISKLQAKVRIALTGTPIENHLGELWSIFNFINPTMLGSLKRFKTNFANPIEQAKNEVKLESLKELVRPYILRRIKSDVLKDLPPKIEQTIYIEPTEEEKAFYEAIREKAQEKLLNLDETSKIAILAEITKLRMACCDSSIVQEDIKLNNSKLENFINIIKNIVENGHKVLVFSQFVKFLTKAKELLDKEKVKYHYIDGATTKAQRQKSVGKFQAGDGDAFLLSLKAGGSGLNLTAADYVIHLDPWWNPAVEDQASDRAHRIGQKRTVTIYRLIMKNTIEEKILAMHANKRSLANDILSGDLAGSLSDQELMELLS